MGHEQLSSKVSKATKEYERYKLSASMHAEMSEPSHRFDMC